MLVRIYYPAAPPEYRTQQTWADQPYDAADRRFDVIHVDLERRVVRGQKKERIGPQHLDGTRLVTVAEVAAPMIEVEYDDE